MTRPTTGPGSRDCPSLKRRFGSRADVETFLANHRATKARHAPRMKAYRCPDCGDFHLTHRQTWRPPRPPKGASW